MNKLIVKLKEVTRNMYLFGIGRLIRRFWQRPLPRNDDGRILIHLGCGDLNDKRFINVDSRLGWHIHYVENIENCSKIFPLDYADLIYACHVLEHVSHLCLVETLKGLHKILKNNGILRLSVPNFHTIVDIYNERNAVQDIIAPLMGGQGYAANYHTAVFNKEYLANLLLRSGFKEVREWDPEKVDFHSFDDWSRRKIRIYDRDWLISLNLEAIK